VIVVVIQVSIWTQDRIERFFACHVGQTVLRPAGKYKK